MSLANEASYLYNLSKEFTSLNKEIHSKAKEAQRHRNKHAKAKEDKKKQHANKYQRSVTQIKRLRREQKRVLEEIKDHYAAFAHSLQQALR